MRVHVRRSIFVALVFALAATIALEAVAENILDSTWIGFAVLTLVAGALAGLIAYRPLLRFVTFRRINAALLYGCAALVGGLFGATLTFTVSIFLGVFVCPFSHQAQACV